MQSLGAEVNVHSLTSTSFHWPKQAKDQHNSRVGKIDPACIDETNGNYHDHFLVATVHTNKNADVFVFTF